MKNIFHENIFLILEKVLEKKVLGMRESEKKARIKAKNKSEKREKRKERCI